MKSCGCTDLSCLLTLSVGLLLSRSLARHRGRSGVSRISRPRGSIERLDRLPDLAAAISHKWLMSGRGQVCVCLPVDQIYSNLRHQKTREAPSFTSHYPVLKEVATMLMVTLQGRPQGGKHQITLLRTVGRSPWVGCSQMVETCVWCV